MFDTAHWLWPQWTMFVCAILNLITAAVMNGKPRSEHSFPTALVGFGLGLFVLVAGGFYS